MSINLIGRAFINTDVQQNTAVAAFSTPTHSVAGITNDATDVVAIVRAVRLSALDASINQEQRALPETAVVPLSLANLLAYSDQVDQWNLGGSGLRRLTIVNQDIFADPFGGNATDEITHTLESPPSDIVMEAQQNVTVVPNTDYNISVFSRQPPTPDNATHLHLRVTGVGVQPRVAYDMRDGGITLITGAATNLSSTLEDNGLYRCSFTFNTAGNSLMTMRLSVADGTGSGDDRVPSDQQHALYWVGMQLTQGPVLKPYKATGATPTNFNPTVVGTTTGQDTDITASSPSMSFSANNAILGSTFNDTRYPLLMTPRGATLNTYQSNLQAITDRMAIGLMDAAQVIGFDSGTQVDQTPTASGYVSRTDGNREILNAHPTGQHYLFTYHNVTEAFDLGSPARTAKMRDYLDSLTGPNGDDGWAYNSAGQKVLLFGDQYTTNISDFVQPEFYAPTGEFLTYPEWYVDEMIEQEYFAVHRAAGIPVGGPGAVNVFLDNHQIHSNKSGIDWNNSGGNDDAQDFYDPEYAPHVSADPIAVQAYSAVRRNMRKAVERMLNWVPNHVPLLNTNQWADREADRLIPTDPADLRTCILEYRLDGDPDQGYNPTGLSENNSDNRVDEFPRSGVGANGLNRGQAGVWDQSYSNIYQSYRLSQSPNIIAGYWTVECMQQGVSGPGGKKNWPNVPASNAKWSMARWAMCTSWLAGAHAAISGIEVGTESTGRAQTTPLFDEFGLINGAIDYGFGTGITGLRRKWMGEPVEEPPLEPLVFHANGGLWCREFENAFIIVNSDNDETNPAESFPLWALPSGQWKRITGVQDPVTNDGSQVTDDIPINPIDAIVLERVQGGYPKTSTYRVGASQSYALDNADGEYQREGISRLDLVTLHMNPDVWGGGGNAPPGWLTNQEIVDDLKARNPDLKVYDYSNGQETTNTDYSGISKKLYDESGPASGLSNWTVKDYGVTRNGTQIPQGSDLAPFGPYSSGDLGNPVSDWWVRDGSGAKVTTFNNPSLTSYNWTINITDFAQPDSNFDRYPVWQAKTIIVPERLVPHTSVGPGPTGLDGMYLDVFRTAPKSSRQDFNGDGAGDVADDIWDAYDTNENHSGAPETLAGGGLVSAGAWRSGYRSQLDYLKGQYPTISIIANITSWDKWDYQGIVNNPLNVQPEYQITEGTSVPLVDYTPRQTIVEGGILESISSTELAQPKSQVNADGEWTGFSFGGWDLSYSKYHYYMEITSGDKMVCADFQIGCTTRIGTSLGEATWDWVPASNSAWNLVRWGLCFTLMGNGYFNVSAQEPNTTNTGKFNSHCLFDEFGTINTSTTGLRKGWLGQPREAPQTAPKQGGNIWWREFDNGLVVVNTENNDTEPATVVQVNSLPGGPGAWKRINGFQDSSTNDGSTVNSNFSIDPIDGIILERV